MCLAPWRSPLARALHLNRSLPYSRYLQLATIRLDGRPANRTVVFRGFLEPTNQLKFITDNRSEKVAQLIEQPWAELCWYFPKSREQFRFLGTLAIVGVNYPEATLVKARQRQWQELSDAARQQFAWPVPKQLKVDAAAFESQPDAAQPIENFCLLLLDPIEVDHLELRGEPQNRTLYRYKSDQADQLESNWTIESVNP